MNVKHFSFIFLCAFILGICLILPIAIMYTPPTTSPCGWADFDETVTDLQDDVVQYPIAGTPEEAPAHPPADTGGDNGEAEIEEEDGGGFSLPCGSSALMILFAFASVMWMRRRYYIK